MGNKPKYRFADANLNSEKEAIERLMNGESFYENEGKIRYSYTEKIYFRFIVQHLIYLGDGEYGYSDYGISSQEQVINFNRIKYWKIRLPEEWYDNIPSHGILCRVSDNDFTKEAGKETAALNFKIVQHYDSDKDYPFRIGDNFGYRFAEPIRLDDIRILQNQK